MTGRHLVLIPAYDAGPLLARTVADALAQWTPVWVVDDGSTDGAPASLAAAMAGVSSLRVLHRARNGGKGAAVATGARAALEAGFTHALVMDADGQHPAACIAAFMEASRAAPEAMILGQPVFGPDAPRHRLLGRRLSNLGGRIAARGGPVGDVLFGFRVYPLAPLLAVMAATRRMRGFDFDPEAVVRLTWAGVPARHLPAPVRYLPRGSGGVSHFNYLRDNLLLAWMHLRLCARGLAARPRAAAPSARR